jgi:4-amino-4-deoxychorismate lyase
MFPLLESIRIENGEIQLFSLHQKRMQKSLQSMGKKMGFLLSECVSIHKFDKHNIYKLRIAYNHTHFQSEIIKYYPKGIKSVQLVKDDNIEYELKYSNRTIIEKLYHKKQNADEIIIVKNGEITDSSFANIIFFDGKEWHTPKTPLLKGVMREHLLSQEKIKKKSITTQKLTQYKTFMFINALLPFDIKRQMPVSAIKK